MGSEGGGGDFPGEKIRRKMCTASIGPDHKYVVSLFKGLLMMLFTIQIFSIVMHPEVRAAIKPVNVHNFHQGANYVLSLWKGRKYSNIIVPASAYHHQIFYHGLWLQRRAVRPFSDFADLDDDDDDDDDGLTGEGSMHKKEKGMLAIVKRSLNLIYVNYAILTEGILPWPAQERFR